MSRKQKDKCKKSMDSETFSSMVDKLKEDNNEHISQIENIINKSFNDLKKINLHVSESEDLDKKEKEFADSYNKLIRSLRDYKQKYNSFTDSINNYFSQIIDDYNKKSNN